MTREEAIEILNETQVVYFAPNGKKKVQEALDMAIEVLSEPSKVDYRTDESANIGTEVNDLISRADAIKAVCNAQCELDVPHYPQCDQVKWCDEIKALESLPSADAENTVSMYSFTELLSEYRGVCEDNENLKKEIAEYEDALKYWQEDCSKLEHKLAESREKAVQGEWLPIEETLPTYDGGEKPWLTGMKCSNCGKLFDLRVGYYYCPNCGAIMKGGAE